MGEVVSIVNQKGGVGKTTVTLGLASAAAERGHSVLVVDLDPQGASTWTLGVDQASLTATVADVVASGRRSAARSAVTASTWTPLIDVLPASPDLQDLEVLRNGIEARLLGTSVETRLRRALHDLADGYAMVLVDCPPALGALTTNALAASTRALLVVEPTALGLRGVRPVLGLIDTVRERHNQHVEFTGTIANRVPGRSNDAAAQLEELAAIVGKWKLWAPPIPLRVALAEAATNRQSIHALGARGRRASTAFDTLYSRLWRLVKPSRA